MGNKKIKSLSIEINENFTEQFEKTIEIMSKYEFKILQKKNNQEMFKNTSFNKKNIYIFIR